MRLCIAVPTYNRAELLGPTIDSILSVDVPDAIRHLRLLLIANNCTDDTEAVVQKRISRSNPFEVVLLRETQQGLCYCRNRAIAEAVGDDAVVLLDDDIQLHRRWLHGFVESVSEQAADCVVGPVFAKFPGGVPEFMTPKAVRSLSSPYSLKGDAIRLLPKSEAHEIPGCNFAVSVPVAREIGGFDNALDRVGKQLIAGGDFEFGHRLAAAGKRVVYHPDCAIDHIIASEKLSPEYMRRRWRGVGATIRAMSQRTNGSAPRPARYFPGLIRLQAQRLKFRLLGKQPEEFDVLLEIEKLQGLLGY